MDPHSCRNNLYIRPKNMKKTQKTKFFGTFWWKEYIYICRKIWKTVQIIIKKYETIRFLSFFWHFIKFWQGKLLYNWFFRNWKIQFSFPRRYRDIQIDNCPFWSGLYLRGNTQQINKKHDHFLGGIEGAKTRGFYTFFWHNKNMSLYLRGNKK